MAASATGILLIIVSLIGLFVAASGWTGLTWPVAGKAPALFEIATGSEPPVLAADVPAVSTPGASPVTGASRVAGEASRASALPTPAPSAVVTAVVRPASSQASSEAAHSVVRPSPTPLPRPLPITRAVIPSIGLEEKVVPAPLVEKDGRKLWEVPAFTVGHLEYSGGAGQRGNAVLTGHVSSIRSGQVFKDLEKIRVGDLVHVDSGPRRFNYRVTEIRVVARDDLTVLQPTSVPTVTLITCTGTWLPLERDYAERLAIRAEIEPTTNVVESNRR